ncbi:MAG: SemiSWEET transporter [Nanoarchaeota archaeon]|nr:SemiSWEET transporter [Nanoarchaeota archaeon]
MEFTTLIGIIAATLTTSSFLPQVIKTLKTKHTKSLSLGMYSLFTVGVFLWTLYGIKLNDPSIYIANGIVSVFAIIILTLIIKHNK